MKKSLKIACALLLTVIMLFTLTGCRNTEILAVEVGRIGMGSLNRMEILEFTFRNNELQSVTAVYEFESEEYARDFYDIFRDSYDEISVSRNRIILETIDAEEFFEEIGETFTREDFSEIVQLQYTVR